MHVWLSDWPPHFRLRRLLASAERVLPASASMRAPLITVRTMS